MSVSGVSPGEAARFEQERRANGGTGDITVAFSPLPGINLMLGKPTAKLPGRIRTELAAFPGTRL
jgi:hypothetical protein